jgi:hypothetical protein
VVVTTPAEVREKFRRVKPFGEIKGSARVWHGDRTWVTQGGQDMGNTVTPSMTTGAASERGARASHFTRELEKLHPDNPVNNRVTRGGPACPRQNPPATSSLTRPRFSAARRPSSPALRNSPDKSAVAGVCHDLIFQHQDAKIRKVFPGALALKTKKTARLAPRG